MSSTGRPAGAPHLGLEAVRQRGHLRVAVSLGLPGLSSMDRSGVWSGLDVDFARAVAVAVLGDADCIEWLPCRPDGRTAAVACGRADLGAANTTWTTSREEEVLFVGVLCHDGEGLLVRRDVPGAAQLIGRTVAVQQGTTTVQNLAAWACADGVPVEVEEFDTPGQALTGYLSGGCEAYVLDRTALAGLRSTLTDPEAHRLLDDTISEEPMAPFVALDAVELLRIARTCLHLIVRAEAAAADGELSVVLATADAVGPAIGASPTWASDVLDQVGHYGQIFDRNLGDSSPLRLPRGRNALWRHGGLMYAPPVR